MATGPILFRVCDCPKCGEEIYGHVGVANRFQRGLKVFDVGKEVDPQSLSSICRENWQNGGCKLGQKSEGAKPAAKEVSL